MFWHIRCALLVALAVVSGLLWSLVPRRFRPSRPFAGKGLRTVLHTPSSGQGWVWCLYFGPGAGYIGGATLYLGHHCRLRVRRGTWDGRPRRWAVGLTGNGNAVPLAGR